jgi:hypothetical protein
MSDANLSAEMRSLTDHANNMGESATKAAMGVFTSKN